MDCRQGRGLKKGKGLEWSTRAMGKGANSGRVETLPGISKNLPSMDIKNLE